MDSIQDFVGKCDAIMNTPLYDDMLSVPLRNVILYLEKQFGRRFVMSVSRCEGDFSYLMKVPMGIEDEMRLRFAYKIGKDLIDAYGKRTARSWLFGTNQALNKSTPVSCLCCARSLSTLKEVLVAAESFCYQ